MRLHAYVLAADPAWLERSLLSYYDIVDEIVVSYDRSGRGWTGAAVPVKETLERLEAVDRDGKLRRVGGDYASAAPSPIECDTAQRQEALLAAGRGADWVLQIDTDEVLPRPERLLELLGYADDHGLEAVEWPMRVLFRSLRGGRYLEVCDRDGRDRFEYPGPIAVRPGARLIDARRAEAPFLRPTVRGDDRSLQLVQPAGENETRAELLTPEEAILHYSWAGSSERVRSKISSWGHSSGWRSQAFYGLRWCPAPHVWRLMRDFHPFSRGLWPALKISDVARDD